MNILKVEEMMTAKRERERDKPFLIMRVLVSLQITNCQKLKYIFIAVAWHLIITQSFSDDDDI